MREFVVAYVACGVGRRGGSGFDGVKRANRNLPDSTRRDADTMIHFNPMSLRMGTTEDWQAAPVALWLAHELIHADEAA